MATVVLVVLVALVTLVTLVTLVRLVKELDNIEQRGKEEVSTLRMVGSDLLNGMSGRSTRMVDFLDHFLHHGKA